MLPPPPDNGTLVWSEAPAAPKIARGVPLHVAVCPKDAQSDAALEGGKITRGLPVQASRLPEPVPEGPHDQDKVRLELALLGEQQRSLRLGTELEKLRREHLELKHTSRAQEACAQENDDLRRQLAAYATALQARGAEAAADLAGLRTQLAAYATEIEVLRRENAEQVAGLEEKTERLAAMQGERQELLAVLADTRAHLQGQTPRKPSGQPDPEVEELLDLVRSMSRALAECQESHASQNEALEGVITVLKARHQEARRGLEDATREIAESRGKSDALSGMLEELRKELHRCREEHGRHREAQDRSLQQVLQERDLSLQTARENEEVQRLQEQRVSEIQRGYKEELDAERSQRISLSEELAERTRQDRAKRETRGLSYRQRRHELQLSRMPPGRCTREVKVARAGRVLKKVQFKDGSLADRFVTVAPEDLELRWSKGDHLSRSHSQVDLRTVIRLVYGTGSRAFQLKGSVMPWLCFSLYDTHRSFDFVCPDEASAGAFVCVLARFCGQADGARALQTRSGFLSAQGWCKLRFRCGQMSRMSIPKLFLQALKRSARPSSTSPRSV